MPFLLQLNILSEIWSVKGFRISLSYYMKPVIPVDAIYMLTILGKVVIENYQTCTIQLFVLQKITINHPAIIQGKTLSGDKAAIALVNRLRLGVFQLAVMTIKLSCNTEIMVSEVFKVLQHHTTQFLAPIIERQAVTQ
ncbi:hypothetical protein AYI86_19505 [Shewanella algae]|nr:hypothetical protein AYI86_19505 [Shewanella algae]